MRKKDRTNQVNVLPSFSEIEEGLKLIDDYTRIKYKVSLSLIKIEKALKEYVKYSDNRKSDRVSLFPKAAGCLKILG